MLSYYDFHHLKAFWFHISLQTPFCSDLPCEGPDSVNDISATPLTSWIEIKEFQHKGFSYPLVTLHFTCDVIWVKDAQFENFSPILLNAIIRFPSTRKNYFLVPFTFEIRNVVPSAQLEPLSLTYKSPIASNSYYSIVTAFDKYTHWQDSPINFFSLFSMILLSSRVTVSRFSTLLHAIVSVISVTVIQLANFSPLLTNA